MDLIGVWYSAFTHRYKGSADRRASGEQQAESAFEIDTSPDLREVEHVLEMNFP